MGQLNYELCLDIGVAGEKKGLKVELFWVEALK